MAIIWGAVALIVFSASEARGRGADPTPVVLEHLGAGTLVVVASYFVGMWISTVF